MTREDQENIQKGLLVSLPVCRRIRPNSNSQRIREQFPTVKKPEYQKPLLLYCFFYFSEDKCDRMLTWNSTPEGQAYLCKVSRIFLSCQQPAILVLTSAALLSLRPLDPAGTSMDDSIEPIGIDKPYIDAYDHRGIWSELGFLAKTDRALEHLCHNPGVIEYSHALLSALWVALKLAITLKMDDSKLIEGLLTYEHRQIEESENEIASLVEYFMTRLSGTTHAKTSEIMSQRQLAPI